MKNRLKENWFKVGLLATLVISIAGAFYWYGLRPSQVRKECMFKSYYSLSFSKLSQSDSEKEQSYKECLRVNGLEK